MTKKKKVILLSLYFPPCNITASQRVFSWAKYLSIYGFYPIVITRRWDYPIIEQSDAYKECGPGIIHEVNENYEVYFLPYKPSLRDKILVKHGESGCSVIRRVLTLIEIMSFNFTNFFLPYRNLYSFTKKYLQKNNDIRLLVTTAYPFSMFRFAWLLKKKFPGLKWVADYRDLWTELKSELFIPHKGFWNKIRWKLEPASERRWLSNAEAFTTVSEKYVEVIGEFTGKAGAAIFNGFFEEDYDMEIAEPKANVFNITYLGTLKKFQNIEMFLDAFERAVKHFKGSVEVKLRFVGTAYEEDAAARLNNYTSNYSDSVEISKRVDRKEAIRMQLESQLLLLVSYSKRTGGTGSKIYEYLGARKPIILCPSDEGLMEKIVLDSGLGYVCNSSEEAFLLLTRLVEEHLNYAGKTQNTKVSKAGEFYSRRVQTGVLGKLLEEVEAN